MNPATPPSRRPSVSGARRSRMYLLALSATPLLALASARAGTDPAHSEPEGLQTAQAGSSGLAGSGSGGAPGGWPGLGGSGNVGRGGAHPLGATLRQQAAHTTLFHTTLFHTTLCRNVQMENGSEQALGDPAGSLVVAALTSDPMVTANGSCDDEVHQVGIVRNPPDRAP